MTAVRFASVSVMLALSGCPLLGVPDSDTDPCGTLSSIHQSGEPWTFLGPAHIAHATAGNHTVWSFTISDTWSCNEQDIPYDLTVLVGPPATEHAIVCSSTVPEVTVTEVATGAPRRLDLAPKDGGHEIATFAHRASLALSSPADPASWALVMNVTFDAADAADAEQSCAEDRILQVVMNATFEESKKERPGATPTLVISTPTAAPPKCGDGKNVRLPAGDLVNASVAADDGTRREYSWTVGAQKACGSIPITYQGGATIRAPREGSGCPTDAPLVALSVNGPGEPERSELAPTTMADGTSLLFDKTGTLDVRKAGAAVVPFYLTLEVSFLATDHGPKDDACARLRVGGLILEGAYAEPGA